MMCNCSIKYHGRLLKSFQVDFLLLHQDSLIFCTESLYNTILFQVTIFVDLFSVDFIYQTHSLTGVFENLNFDEIFFIIDAMVIFTKH